MAELYYYYLILNVETESQTTLTLNFDKQRRTLRRYYILPYRCPTIKPQYMSSHVSLLTLATYNDSTRADFINLRHLLPW